jgi:hypothetical protein
MPHVDKRAEGGIIQRLTVRSGETKAAKGAAAVSPAPIP